MFRVFLEHDQDVHRARILRHCFRVLRRCHSPVAPSQASSPALSLTRLLCNLLSDATRTRSRLFQLGRHFACPPPALYWLNSSTPCTVTCTFSVSQQPVSFWTTIASQH